MSAIPDSQSEIRNPQSLYYTGMASMLVLVFSAGFQSNRSTAGEGLTSRLHDISDIIIKMLV